MLYKHLKAGDRFRFATRTGWAGEKLSSPEPAGPTHTKIDGPWYMPSGEDQARSANPDSYVARVRSPELAVREAGGATIVLEYTHSGDRIAYVGRSFADAYMRARRQEGGGCTGTLWTFWCQEDHPRAIFSTLDAVDTERALRELEEERFVSVTLTPREAAHETL